ncbi:MAG: LD-carboxypeptidase [Alcaligenaceae bacterium]|nr:LD-carboxypeptidase [Alcaligenaceae bacterium]
MSKKKTKKSLPSVSEPSIHDAPAPAQESEQHGHDHVRPAPPGIYLISPSGGVTDTEGLERGRKQLKSMGFKVKLDPAAKCIHERFAGTDKQRADSFDRAVEQKHPIIMATRGGYGLSRILPLIDWHDMARSGKIFVGQSDFTAFSLALLAKTGAVSYAGPTAIHDFGARKVDDLTVDLFVEMLTGQLEILSFKSKDADPVDTRGVLWGGNLAMVASLVGTPFMPQVNGGILFLEDIGEHPYRIERMLTQLWHAGILDRQEAIVLGHFTNYRLGPHDNGYTLASVVKWLRETVRIPVVTGLPWGHVKVKATLPIGRQVGLATEKGMAHLVFQEHD